jgi:hypothetical protein
MMPKSGKPDLDASQLTCMDASRRMGAARLVPRPPMSGLPDIGILVRKSAKADLRCFETHRSAVELAERHVLGCAAMLLSMRPIEGHRIHAI